MKNVVTGIIITLLVAFATLAWINRAHAENTNPIVDTVDTVKEKAINNPVTQFIINEKNEIVQYQKDSWEQGKQQLARNKQQISGFFDTLAEAIGHYAPKSNESTNTENR